MMWYLSRLCSSREDFTTPSKVTSVGKRDSALNFKAFIVVDVNVGFGIDRITSPKLLLSTVTWEPSREFDYCLFDDISSCPPPLLDETGVVSYHTF